MPPEGRSNFPKQARLRKRPEFRNLARTGEKYHTSNFVIITQNSGRCETRLGITVSSKVGNAVGRNRGKRILREFFRRCRREIRPNKDVLIIARKGAANLSLRDMTRELRGSFPSDRMGAP